jgi:hypothetical protein
MPLFRVQWVMVEKKTAVEPFLSSTARVISFPVYLFISFPEIILRKNNYPIVHFPGENNFYFALLHPGTVSRSRGLHDSFSKADARCACVRIDMGYE